LTRPEPAHPLALDRLGSVGRKIIPSFSRRSGVQAGETAASLPLPGACGIVVVGGPAEGLRFLVGLDAVLPRLAAVLVGIAADEQPQRRVVEFGDGEDDPGDLLRITVGDVLEPGHGAGRRADVSWYGALGDGVVMDAPAQSVRIPPGSSTVTLMPSGATSAASASLNPPTAHFADW
jgi:hypothetical protein